MCDGVRYVVNEYYYGKSGRGVPSDIFKNYSLNTCPSWPQTLSFECREVRKKERMDSILIVHFVYVYVSIEI